VLRQAHAGLLQGKYKFCRHIFSTKSQRAELGKAITACLYTTGLTN
jgi:hypothetical protein